jgi:hypothetical protein
MFKEWLFNVANTGQDGVITLEVRMPSEPSSLAA